MTSVRRRLIVMQLREQFHASERRVLRALDLPRSGIRYVPVVRDEQTVLVRRIEELACIHPRFGYRRIWALLDREGWVVNKKAVRRIWRLSGLKIAKPRADPKPRRPQGQAANACHLRPSRGKDDVWTWDFIFDRTCDGRSLKWLSLIDEYTRECLALEVRRNMTADQIYAVLADASMRRGGPPHRVRSDNGPEFAAEIVQSWLAATGSGTLYVAPASPWQNGFAESFHSKLRDEFLNREEFENEVQAQALGDLWKEEYNTERPHSSLNYKTPAEFASTCARYLPIEEPPTTKQQNKCDYADLSVKNPPIEQSPTEPSSTEQPNP